MPKLKKTPKNAYYFFMVDRKQELEARGFRFPGGMSDVATAVRQEWTALKPEEKAYFEDLAKKAKEDEKLNFNNKFTATGESYAHVMERNAYEEEVQFTMERLVDDLTIASETVVPENRNFIIIKTIHSCEVLLPRQAFWPLEIAMASFNLADGMKKSYWTLVDTVNTPVGYASAAKETTEETGLPQPGSRVFEEKHRDYAKILRNIKKFVEQFLADYGPKYILFAMGPDIKSVNGCLQWLSDNAELNEKERFEMDGFMNKLTIYKLPKLLLRFANIAKRRNEYYNHVMALFNGLEKSAESVLMEGCFNYRDDITCEFHKQEEPSIKMDVCCKNVVIRLIYLIIKEIVPAMKIEMKEGHEIESFGKFSRKTAPVVPPAGQVPVPGRPSGSSATSASGASGSSRPPPRSTRTNDPREHEESTFLSESWGNPMPQYPIRANPYETDASAPAAASGGGGAGDTRPVNNLPWGRPREAPTASFTEDDFPALGGESNMSALWGNSRNDGGRGGRGRGQTGPAPNDGPGGAFRSAVGRGRGGR